MSKLKKHFLNDSRIGLTLHVIPDAQRRPQVTCRGNIPTVYTHKKDKKYKKKVKQIVGQISENAMDPFRDSEGPMHVSFVFYMPTPKYRSKKVEKATKNDELFLVDKMPDLDNLEKSITDAIEEFFFGNDGRISMKFSAKVYADGDPRVDVFIMKVGHAVPTKLMDKFVRYFNQLA